MRSTRIATVAAALGGLALLFGCGQQQQPPAPPAPATTQPPAATTTPPAESAAPAATAPTVAEAADQAQGLIDKAKGLIADKKYTEALDVLKQLSALKLTPDQQTLVDGLKAEIQKAMASAAASDATKKATDAVGGVLGK